ncbi:unnamed protein product, partial [Prorocentrum cordatum]
MSRAAPSAPLQPPLCARDGGTIAPEEGRWASRRGRRRCGRRPRRRPRREVCRHRRPWARLGPRRRPRAPRRGSRLRLGRRPPDRARACGAGWPVRRAPGARPARTRAPSPCRCLRRIGHHASDALCVA